MGNTKKKRPFDGEALKKVSGKTLERIAEESYISSETLKQWRKGLTPDVINAIGKSQNIDPERLYPENQDGIARLKKASFNPSGIDDLFTYESDFVKFKKAKEDSEGFLRQNLAFAGVASAFDVLTEQEKAILIMKIENLVNNEIKIMHPELCHDCVVPDPELLKNE